MAANDSPQAVSTRPLPPAEEIAILAQIKKINWDAIPFCKVEVRVRNGKPCSIVLEKTYLLKPDNLI